MWSRRPYYGVEGGLGLRPVGQMRFIFTIGAGVRSSLAAGRVAGEAQFLVLPASRTGLSPYLGLGIAGTILQSRHSSAALTVTAGVEGAEGKRVGWYVEGGAAGGGRLAAGIRWRRFPAWWR